MHHCVLLGNMVPLQDFLFQGLESPLCRETRVAWFTKSFVAGKGNTEANKVTSYFSGIINSPFKFKNQRTLLSTRWWLQWFGCTAGMRSNLSSGQPCIPVGKYISSYACVAVGCCIYPPSWQPCSIWSNPPKLLTSYPVWFPSRHSSLTFICVCLFLFPYQCCLFSPSRKWASGGPAICLLWLSGGVWGGKWGWQWYFTC